LHERQEDGHAAQGPRAELEAVDASSEIPGGDYTVPIGKGIVRREGTDVTIVAPLLMMHRSPEAAAMLVKEGISVEVIDPRSLVPFDWHLVKGSIEKTGRVSTVEQSPRHSGAGAEIVATIAEEMLDILVVPVKLVTAPDTPALFSPAMERYYVPEARRIAAAARDMLAESQTIPPADSGGRNDRTWRGDGRSRTAVPRKETSSPSTASRSRGAGVLPERMEVIREAGNHACHLVLDAEVSLSIIGIPRCRREVGDA